MNGEGESLLPHWLIGLVPDLEGALEQTSKCGFGAIRSQGICLLTLLFLGLCPTVNWTNGLGLLVTFLPDCRRRGGFTAWEQPLAKDALAILAKECVKSHEALQQGSFVCCCCYYQEERLV